ncbi:SDR family NAD(P)-dependent oxidoreductase [Mycolicibacterium neoaurum]|uniref:SDR family NAD(P)-dependent oxidoreductase n=1 Tax=Mycolicibacterium neoaurum TaxID=1795 RepID=UPI001F4C75A4|nr:SDR family oxidoreductase [Mycolicibacterium neoaurum]UNG43182.1 putative oxidoreductase [Mycolicibacterium neoaurum]
MSMDGRTIIVTGAASGIGETTARHLAGLGANVVIADIDPEGEKLVADIRESGGGALFVRTDVSNAADVEAMVAQAVSQFGSIEGAFNNAGVEQASVPLHEVSSEQWARVLGVDLTGVFNCLKYEIAAMLTTGGGSIVNVGSCLGASAMPNAAEYIAAKHGVVGLTRAAAADYATQGIRVNAVMPGVTNTRMIQRASQDPTFAAHFDAIRRRHAMERFADTSEISSAVVWLLSDAASFITGADLAVDGGWLAT